MADLKVTIRKVYEILEHPNADRMDLAIIGGSGGWQCCVQQGSLRPGDHVVYFPVDSVLPDKTVEQIFGPDSKIKLSKNRIRTIKLRGAISQGLAVPIAEIKIPQTYYNDMDLTKWFGVEKYEPPIKGSPQAGTRKATSRNTNPNFAKYTSIEHLRNYPDALEGEYIVACEKIHGTNFRAGYVPSVAHSMWDHIKKLLGMFKPYQFVYGSHNVQLQQKPNRKTGFYKDKLKGGDPYTRAVGQYYLRSKLKDGEEIYAEIYGWQIQKGFGYDAVPGEIKMVVIDLKIDGVYQSTTKLLTWCFENGLNWAPIVYQGEYDAEKINRVAGGPSILCPDAQAIREGVVVRTSTEQTGHMGRKIFKILNPEYLLLKDQTEHH